MKKELTEIVCILDRSGSMGSIMDDAIGGFNAFLDDQKKEEGDANITVVVFDDEVDTIHDNINLAKVPQINKNVYFPRGTTALNDAIGMTMTNVGQRLSNTPEDQRPEKVIVAVLTDGMENASKEYTSEDIKEMISHQESVYNWQFIYLAANQDAFSVGQTYGFSSHNSVTFNATGKGAKNAFENVSLYSSVVRGIDAKMMDARSVAKMYSIKEED